MRASIFLPIVIRDLDEADLDNLTWSGAAPAPAAATAGSASDPSHPSRPAERGNSPASARILGWRQAVGGGMT